jgi:hypothetical protein
MGKSRTVKGLCLKLPSVLLLTREERRRILFAPISIQSIGGKSHGGTITQVDGQFTNRTGQSYEEQSWSRRNPRFDEGEW